MGGARRARERESAETLWCILMMGQTARTSGQTKPNNRWSKKKL